MVDGGSRKKTEQNKNKAERFLGNYLATFNAKEAGTAEKKNNQMLADTAKEWLEHQRGSKVPGTIAGYTYCVNDIVLYFETIHPMRTRDITSLDVEKYLDWERKRRQPGYVGEYKVISRYANGSGIENTVKHRYTTLRSIMQYAKRLGVVDRNCASKRDSEIHIPQPQKQEFPVLTLAEAQRLINELETEPLWFQASVYMGLMYGLRRSEIIGINESDIDWTENSIVVKNTVTQQTVDHQNCVITKPFTKNRNYKQFVLSDHLGRLFRDLLCEHHLHEKQFGKDYDTRWTGYLIRYADGNLVSPNALTNKFKQFLKKHSLKEVRLHDLRHSCASILYANGTDIMTIQEILGHAQLTTTIMYTHKISDRKTSALAQMHDQFLAPTSGKEKVISK